MYTHGSRIWFQVAKRSQRSRYLTWRGPLDSTVFAIKTCWWKDGGGDKDGVRSVKKRQRDRGEMWKKRI